MRRAALLGAALLVAGGGVVVVGTAAAAATTYQAEAAQLSGGARAESEHGGFTGAGYAGGFTDGNRGNATASFAVAGSGATTLTIRYANGTGSARTMSLLVNGEARQITLPPTANWATWATATQSVALTAGADTVALRYGTADNGNVNVDSIAAEPAPPAPAGTYEAETAQLSGGARAESEHGGFTGAGYAGGFTDGNRGNATVSFTVTGSGPLTIRYANGTGSARTLTLLVNGAGRQITLPATANWATWATVTESAALGAGTNTVALRYGTADNGNVNVDSLAVSAASPTTTTPPPGGSGHELETAFLAGGATADGGHVTGLGAGARVIRTVRLPAAATAATTLRFRNTTGGTRTISVYANGLKAGQLTLPAGGDWQTVTRDLPLRAGVNLVGYQVDPGDSGGVQLDHVAVAGSAPLAARGATLPYTTYEAEDGQTTGAVLPAGRTYTTLQAEASGRRAVTLTGTGQYVQWTLTQPANAVTVRASIPDGGDAPLALYAGGAKVADLTLTARYSWMYGAYPFAEGPGGANPHRFFDDARALLPRTYPAGTVLRLAKDTAATASVTVDLLEAEVAEAPQPAPAGYVSVTSHGAVPGDAGDDTNAFRAAVAQGRGVWIPAGTYRVSGLVRVAGIDVRGAGMWHTVLQGVNRRGGFFVTGGNTQLGDFTFDGDVTTRDPDAAPNSDAAIEGHFGTGSLIRNVATNHAKVGLWVKRGTNGLYATGLRIRNTMADGVNVNNTATDGVAASGDTVNVRVDQSTTRNTGDDALSMWSWRDAGLVRDSVFAFNTLSLPILANGIGIYGGTSNRVEDNLISDTVFTGSGVTLSTWHAAIPFAGTTVVQRTTLTRTGSYSLDWGSEIGALWIYAEASDITAPLVLRDLDVVDSTYQGLLVSWQRPVTNLTLERVAFRGAGTKGMEFNSPGAGTFSYVTVSGTGGPALANNAGFTINRGPGNSGF